MAAVTAAWMMRAAEMWLFATAVAAAAPPAASTSYTPGNSSTATNEAELSNNLISDLAPLLALFGERFTQQFLSFSTSSVDSVLFAIAPLGIITAIVGAIRVAGPPWLRVLVGRARETRATADVELMSSTSHEVCEIWNGEAIVRVIGTPTIVELLYFEELPPRWNELNRKHASQNASREPTEYDANVKFESMGTSQIFTLEEAILKNLVIKSDRDPNTTWLLNLLQKFVRLDQYSIPSSKAPHNPQGNAPSELERGLSHANIVNHLLSGNVLNAYQMANLHSHTNTTRAPNISLNLAASRSGFEPCIAVIFGFCLQCILTIAGPYCLKLLGWGDTPRNSFFYIIAGMGTLFLAFGMFLCATVIDQSTTEKIYQKSNDTKEAKLYLLWLQRGQLITDQTSVSYAIIAGDPAQEIWTSSRQTFGEEPPKLVKFSLVTVGTFLSISGFILQFVGLRNTHWAASVAQLVATMLMTSVRAFIRRRLSKKPLTVSLPKEFELEWLASAILANQEAFGSHYSGLRAMKQQDHHWTNQKWANILGLNRLRRGAPMMSEEVGDDMLKPPTLRVITGGIAHQCTSPCLPGLENAMKVIRIRQRLGRLTKWRNQASSAAVFLANSMELVLNKLLQKSTESFTWGINVYFEGKTQRVHLNIEKEDGRFRVTLAEIESLLSLWLQHVYLQEQQEEARKKDGNEEESNSRWENIRLERETTKQNLRILGQNISSLRQDLKWWLPIDSTTAVRIGKGKQQQDGSTDSGPEHSHYSISHHRIIGFSGTEDAIPESESVTVHFECSISSDQEDGATVDQTRPGHTDNTETDDHPFRAVISTTERELLFAQHIFTAFMWEIAPMITRIRGATETSQIMANVPTAWQNRQLENEVIRKLASGISNTGLGSVDDGLLCIIPPLSAHDKLPSYAAVDEVVQILERNGRDWGKYFPTHRP
ncbi:hypothetical protein BZA77DRAFT_347353 [Pyronema omphalodes]|nr:hypothetical protein BZA77DRAFT_347353 [Pyronema omphalodes]